MKRFFVLFALKRSKLVMMDTAAVLVTNAPDNKGRVLTPRKPFQSSLIF
jgi:hypothetical protein